jgi:hypothetical protein
MYTTDRKLIMKIWVYFNLRPNCIYFTDILMAKNIALSNNMRRELR